MATSVRRMALAAALLLCLSANAAAQDGPLDLPLGSALMDYSGPLFRNANLDPKIIYQQCRYALGRLNLSLQLLSQPSPENVKGAWIAATDAYAFMRVAHETLLVRKAAAKYDPLPGLQEEQLKIARFGIRPTLTQLDGGHGNTPDRVAVATANVSEVIAQLQRAMALMP